MSIQNISLHIIASAGMAMNVKTQQIIAYHCISKNGNEYQIIACHLISLLLGGNGWTCWIYRGWIIWLLSVWRRQCESWFNVDARWYETCVLYFILNLLLAGYSHADVYFYFFLIFWCVVWCTSSRLTSCFGLQLPVCTRWNTHLNRQRGNLSNCLSFHPHKSHKMCKIGQGSVGCECARCVRAFWHISSSHCYLFDSESLRSKLRLSLAVRRIRRNHAKAWSSRMVWMPSRLKNVHNREAYSDLSFNTVRHNVSSSQFSDISRSKSPWDKAF